VVPSSRGALPQLEMVKYDLANWAKPPLARAMAAGLETRRSLRLSKRRHRSASSCFGPSPRKRIRSAHLSQGVRPARRMPGQARPAVMRRWCLLELPLAVLERLLLFLDVVALAKLAATCSFLQQLVAGRHIVVLDFPFNRAFVRELAAAATVEKKPVLRLQSLKDDETAVPDDEEVFVEYMVQSQLALLSLAKLREVQLVPPGLDAITAATQVAGYVMFDRILLRCLATPCAPRCALANLTRLDVLVDKSCHLEEYMVHLPSLLHLGLTVSNLKNISTHQYETFLCRLEATVQACRAPELAVTVLAETKRKVVKVFENRVVERLVVTAPCNFNLHLAMPRVVEVVVDRPEQGLCTYYKSPVQDRLLHRGGLCTVSFASVYQRCPNLRTFAGVDISSVSMEMTFTKWNNRVRKLFHDSYRRCGGEQELKPWARSRRGRWFARQEPLPAAIGHHRAF